MERRADDVLPSASGDGPRAHHAHATLHRAWGDTGRRPKPRRQIGAPACRGSLVNVGVGDRCGSNIEARDLWAKNNALRGVFLGWALPDECPARSRVDRRSSSGRRNRGAAGRDRQDVSARRRGCRARLRREPASSRARSDDALGSRWARLAQRCPTHPRADPAPGRLRPSTGAGVRVSVVYPRRDSDAEKATALERIEA